MSDGETADRHWQAGGMWLAGGAATLMLAVRLLLGSGAAEAAALGMLSGVIVFGLAYLANERPVRRR